MKNLKLINDILNKIEEEISEDKTPIYPCFEIFVDNVHQKLIFLIDSRKVFEQEVKIDNLKMETFTELFKIFKSLKFKDIKKYLTYNLEN
jgi:hypothetical protein